jgi:hypothetical protein
MYLLPSTAIPEGRAVPVPCVNLGSDAIDPTAIADRTRRHRVLVKVARP